MSAWVRSCPTLSRFILNALLDEICSLMAGRVAEEMYLGFIDTGALNDLERATKIAYAMVTYYGMGNELPNISYYTFCTLQ